MDILRSKHVGRNKMNASFLRSFLVRCYDSNMKKTYQLFFLEGFLNCLAGQRVEKRLCESDP